MATGMLVSAAVSAGASVYGGVQAKKAADANALLVEEQAEEVRLQSIDAAGKLRTQGEAFLGTQRAGIASAGVKAGSGSPLAAMKESEANLRTDVDRIRTGGETARTRGFNQAGEIRKEGSDIFGASIFGAGSSFLTGIAAGYVDGPYKDLLKKISGR